MTRYCMVENCGKRSSYGLKTDKSPTYCGMHGEVLGMINIVSKICLYGNCPKQAVFGLSTDKSPTYCGVHGKPLGMIDIKSKRCLQNKCPKQPTFGNLDDTSPTYCEPHGVILGMINIKSKKCLQDGCTKQPSFGNSDDKVAIYCGPHGAPLGMVDIKHKRCLYLSCDNKTPTFGLPDDKVATYCGEHGKLLGMIDIRSKRCLQKECDIKNPVFGYTNDKNGTYCETHKLIGMINIVSKKCETCNSTQMNSKYKPNCARCHFYLNPDDPRIINYKTKEQAYMTALLEAFPQFKLDKTINGGCSKRRPDGFLDLLTHVIIIEIDENEHKSYDNTCNNRRTMELSQDVDHRPIVFIRLNPDSYKLNGTRMKGSFSLTKKTNELKIVKKEFNKRLNSLIKSVEKYIITIPDKTISVEYLYFTTNEI